MRDPVVPHETRGSGDQIHRPQPLADPPLPPLYRIPSQLVRLLPPSTPNFRRQLPQGEGLRARSPREPSASALEPVGVEALVRRFPAPRTPCRSALLLLPFQQVGPTGPVDALTALGCVHPGTDQTVGTTTATHDRTGLPARVRREDASDVLGVDDVDEPDAQLLEPMDMDDVGPHLMYELPERGLDLFIDVGILEALERGLGDVDPTDRDTLSPFDDGAAGGRLRVDARGEDRGTLDLGVLPSEPPDVASTIRGFDRGQSWTHMQDSHGSAAMGGGRPAKATQSGGRR